jgi:hypothetical protein
MLQTIVFEWRNLAARFNEVENGNEIIAATDGVTFKCFRPKKMAEKSAAFVQTSF